MSNEDAVISMFAKDSIATYAQSYAKDHKWYSVTGIGPYNVFVGEIRFNVDSVGADGKPKRDTVSVRARLTLIENALGIISHDGSSSGKIDPDSDMGWCKDPASYQLTVNSTAKELGLAIDRIIAARA